MRGWWLVLVLVGCSEPRLLPEPLSALEDAYERTPALAKTFDPDDVILSPAGVFVHEGRRATNIDLAFKGHEVLATAPAGKQHSIVVMPGTPPASLVMVLNAASRRRWQTAHIGLFDGTTVRSICRATVPPATPILSGFPYRDEVVDLSIYLTVDRVWVGLSRVNEFQEIPNLAAGGIDFAKLEEAIDTHKKSAFFADRDDLQIGADREIDLATWMNVIELVCKHFHAIELTTPEKLIAQPTL